MRSTESLKVKAIYELLKDVDFDEAVLLDLSIKTAQLLKDKINLRWRNHYRKHLDDFEFDTVRLAAEKFLDESEFIERDGELMEIYLNGYVLDIEFDEEIIIRHDQTKRKWYTGYTNAGEQDLNGYIDVDGEVRPFDKQPQEHLVEYAWFLFNYYVASA